MSIIKVALEVPMHHLKGDQKEFKEIEALSKRITKITKGMYQEDATALKGAKKK